MVVGLAGQAVHHRVTAFKPGSVTSHCEATADKTVRDLMFKAVAVFVRALVSAQDFWIVCIFLNRFNFNRLVLLPLLCVSASLWTGNGHYYFHIAQARNWEDARSIAGSFFFQAGLRGYLATTTSAAENAFVASLQSNGIWLGAADTPHRSRNWKWCFITSLLRSYSAWIHFVNDIFVVS
jgi:hypothetical protein